MFLPKPYRQSLYILTRFCLCLYLSVVVANYLNHRNYADYIGRTLVKIHAEARFGLDANQLAKMLAEGNHTKLQELLDRNASIYALAITDCTGVEDSCRGQKILLATNPALLRNMVIRVEDLASYPFVVLRRPSSVLDILEHQVKGGGGKGAIIGRVYSISTIPRFTEDYRRWLRNPFLNDELWRRYLITMTTCLAGGVGFWLFMELFLKIRRIERSSARQRELDLLRDADNSLRQLEQKRHQLEEQELRSLGQFEAYIARIRELEQKQQDVDEYRRSAETIIRELEAEKAQQSLKFREEIQKTNYEKSSLCDELERYRKASQKNKEEASRALESVITPQFGNIFERTVFECISKSAKSQSGDWIVQTHFDVAPGKGGSHFIDCMVISRDCLTVVEAKNYAGIVEAEGDVENTSWHCLVDQNRRAEIKSSWGENPYHQVREYTMNLMRLVQRRSNWTISVYGVVVFPEGADIARISERLGQYYRVTTLDHLVGVLENIQNEAHRKNPFSKRPSPRQVENLIHGRSG